jgi:hypothetical protein
MPYHLATPHCGNTINHIITIQEIVNKSKIYFQPPQANVLILTSEPSVLNITFSLHNREAEMQPIEPSPSDKLPIINGYIIAKILMECRDFSHYQFYLRMKSKDLIKINPIIDK